MLLLTNNTHFDFEVLQKFQKVSKNKIFDKSKIFRLQFIFNQIVFAVFNCYF